MSEECGRTAALAAGRTRKGAGDEGLVSGAGRRCRQTWLRREAAPGEAPLSRAPSRGGPPGPRGAGGGRVRGGAGWKAEPAWLAGPGGGAPWVQEVRGPSPSGWWWWLELGLWTRGEGREVRSRELGRKWGWRGGLLEKAGGAVGASQGSVGSGEEEGSRTACDRASRLPAGEPRGSGGRGLVLLLGPAVPVVLAPVHGLGLRLSPWQVCVQQLRPGDRGQVPSQGRAEPRGPRSGLPEEPRGKGNVCLSPLFHSRSPSRWYAFKAKQTNPGQLLRWARAGEEVLESPKLLQMSSCVTVLV